MKKHSINYMKYIVLIGGLLLCGCGAESKAPANTNTVVNNTYQQENQVSSMPTPTTVEDKEDMVTPTKDPVADKEDLVTPTPTEEPEEERENYFEYVWYDKDSVILYNVIGEGREATELVVPEKVGNQTVIAIGENAFANLEAVKKIQLPDSIISIGENAFYGCSSLEKMNFPMGIEEIGKLAFDGCDKLELPIANVSFTSADEGLVITGFLRRNSNGDVLEVLEIPAEIFGRPVKSIGEKAFLDSYAYKNYILPEGLLTIGSMAFCGNGLCEITLPDTLYRIEGWAFAECFGLKSIIIPDSVTYMGDGAFSECVMLEEITLSKNLVGITKRLFYMCNSLTEVMTYDKLQYIEEKAFLESGIQYLWLQDSVITIADNVFDYDNWNRRYLVTILAPSGSMAEYYANAKGIDVIVLGEDEEEPADETVEEDDILRFGVYEQDNDTSNGKEEIEWYILDERNGKLLLLSKYALDCKTFYDGTETGYTWEKSSLRQWLNGEFLFESFTREEISKIECSELAAPHNTEYGTDGGNATTDFVFVLSMEEVELEFGEAEWNGAVGMYVNEELLAYPTEYAIAKGVFVCDSSVYGTNFEVFDGCCDWWLRSPGEWLPDMAYVSYLGDVYGMVMDYSTIAVRPAIWVDASVLER